MTRIAIIGAGELAAIYAKKAREMGVLSHCFAWDKGAVAKEVVDVFHPVSIFEIDTIEKICRQEGISGVLCTTELTVPVAGELAFRLDLTGQPREVSKNVINKYWVREQLKQADLIRQPQFIYVPHWADWKERRGVFLSQLRSVIGFPLIAKPAAEGGKRGVNLIADERSIELVDLSFQADQRGNGILLEQYLSCPEEYSVEALSFHGHHQIIQVTSKRNSGPPHFIEWAHSQPATISDDLFDRISKVVSEVLDLTRITNGPTHTEIKIIDGEVFLVELNARPGGGGISYPLIELSTGYDYISESIKVALGIQPQKMAGRQFKAFVGTRFVTCFSLYLQHIFDNCDDKAWLVCKHREYDEMKEITDNSQRRNYFMYNTGDTPPDF